MVAPHCIILRKDLGFDLVWHHENGIVSLLCWLASVLFCFVFLKILFIYFRQRGREKWRREGEMERHLNVWLPVTHPLLGTWPGPQPRHVPQPGIKPATLWLTGWRSIHLAIPARAPLLVNKPREVVSGSWFQVFGGFLDLIYLLVERGEREGEKHQCVRDTSIGCLSHTPNWRPGLQPRHLQPRHVPDGELNQQPFRSQASTPSTAPHQPGLGFRFYRAASVLSCSLIFCPFD